MMRDILNRGAIDADESTSLVRLDRSEFEIEESRAAFSTALDFRALRDFAGNMRRSEELRPRRRRPVAFRGLNTVDPFADALTRLERISAEDLPGNYDVTDCLEGLRQAGAGELLEFRARLDYVRFAVAPFRIDRPVAGA